MSPRILAMTVATAAVVITFLGCGSGEPEFDPATKYSPASLAQEFAFRYKSLDRSKPDAPADGVTNKGGAVTKTGAVGKAAQANTLDALLSDVIAKAAAIPKLSHAEACKQVNDEVAKNATFSDADKKLIAERLGKVTND